MAKLWKLFFVASPRWLLLILTPVLYQPLVYQKICIRLMTKFFKIHSWWAFFYPCMFFVEKFIFERLLIFFWIYCNCKKDTDCLYVQIQNILGTFKDPLFELQIFPSKHSKNQIFCKFSQILCSYLAYCYLCYLQKQILSMCCRYQLEHGKCTPFGSNFFDTFF